MTEKILGYVLLALGIIIILFSAISVYQVFTRQAEPVKPFSFSGISLDTGQMLNQSLQNNLPPGLKLPSQPASSQKTEIVSADMINSTANLAAHLLLMGFLASIGQKIASLGVQLVRPINVKLKGQE